MRISISNLAWDVSEDEQVAALLRRYDIDAIDVAPGKYFPDPVNASETDIIRVRKWWRERGIEITGMQALLFGTTGFNLFGPAEVQERMLRHLDAVCRIAAGLGAKWLVFGSPRNRDRSGLSDQQALDIAVAFFRSLGDIAQSHGVIICLEPNPTCYGANFMTTAAETAAVTKAVAHSAIKMQLDTGALTINGEAYADVVRDCAPLIGHVHASEQELLPLGDGNTDHAQVAAVLKQNLPTHVVCIEMLATKNESHEVAIERALKVAIKHYRNDGVEQSV
jgi:sugar phosphate isomerase/epimerase